MSLYVATVTRPPRYQGRRQRTPGYQGHHRRRRLSLSARRRSTRAKAIRAAGQGLLLAALAGVAQVIRIADEYSLTGLLDPATR